MYLTTTSNEITDRERNNAKLARKAGADCIVLLEHDGTLPLKKGSSIALFGTGARHTIKGGTGSGNVVSCRSWINIDEGLLNGGYKLTTTDYLDEYDKIYDQGVIDYDKFVKDTVASGVLHEWTVKAENPFMHPAGPELTSEVIAKYKADACIYVISRISGEGSDRKVEEGDYMLSSSEASDIEALAKEYGNIIVILNVGSVIDISKLRQIKGVGTVLLMGQLGCTGGDALCDVISGDVTPSAKLVDTWAKDYFDFPSSKDFSHNNGNVDDEYYTEGIYVGYRYFDSFGIDKAYCFGYGLSYTSFEINTVGATVNGTEISVKVCVKNVGDYSGKEVVQLYVKKPDSSIKKAKRELCGFAKTPLLAKGEQCELDIVFDMKDITSFDEVSGAYVVEKGDYTIYVGNSLDDAKAKVKVALDETVVLTKCSGFFASDVNLLEISNDNIYSDEFAEFSLSVTASDFTPVTISYTDKNELYVDESEKVLTAQDVIDGKCTAKELVAQLSVEEMSLLCVGITRHNGGIVGEFAKLVPGAAGETSSVCLENRGLRPLVMADGPAGVSIYQTFESEGQIYYHFTTAIPIGWNLAMSWDVELLKSLGKMAGEEMKEYKVDLWLAPALNIHRNPLCGRNFEYYSEDPFITGKMAAAITDGVQSLDGIGTTIKHFAANNLEDNRYFSNSHVSERALREIYLKGFEICVKESHPKALMTSYNLLNGIHTANHRGLVTNVLRDEWGYKGLVMTDWSTAENKPSLTASHAPIYPIASAVGCIAAGNDLIMPGCHENFADIYKSVEENVEIDGFIITLADLQATTLNVVNCIIDSMKAD